MLVILSIHRAHVLSIWLNRKFETESGVSLVHNPAFASVTDYLPVGAKLDHHKSDFMPFYFMPVVFGSHYIPRNKSRPSLYRGETHRYALHLY